MIGLELLEEDINVLLVGKKGRPLAHQNQLIAKISMVNIAIVV